MSDRGLRRAMPNEQSGSGTDGYMQMSLEEDGYLAGDQRSTPLAREDSLALGGQHRVASWTAGEEEKSVNKRWPLRQNSSLYWRYPVVDPMRSTWLHRWDTLNAVQLVAISLIWPYETAFLVPGLDFYFVLNRVFDTMLVADMCIQFFSAYPDPLRPERSVKDPKAICKHYLRGWFWTDLLAVLPLDLIYVLVSASGHKSNLFRFLRPLRYLRIVRLVRLTRFVQLVERWNTCFGIAYSKITMIKLLVALMLCCHWTACVWGAIYVNFSDQKNWLDALRAAKGGPDLEDDDFFSIYILALYWSVITITSIGYGDVTPQTVLEYKVATVSASIMAAVWAYVIGAICGIVANLDQHDLLFKRTMDDLNWLMHDKEMPQYLRQRLRRYFYEAREMNKQKVEQTVISQMSPLLQGEVAMFMHSRWLGKVWYLRDLNQEIIVWAARNLALAVFAPNEDVLDERTLFIVQRGVCIYKGKVLVSGDVWGEDMLLSNPILREQSKARALSHLSVLTLHIVDLFEIVSCFNEARAALRWAQIQIATTRAIIRIARVVRSMQKKQHMDWFDFTEDQRAQLYQQILTGCAGESGLTKDVVAFHRRNTRTSIQATDAALMGGCKEGEPNLPGSISGASREGQGESSQNPWTTSIAELTATVQDLKTQLRIRSQSKLTPAVTKEKFLSDVRVDFGPLPPPKRGVGTLRSLLKWSPRDNHSPGRHSGPAQALH